MPILGPARGLQTDCWSNSRIYSRQVKPMIRLIALVSAAFVGALTVAAPAHADDQSFLNYLETHGQTTTAWPFNPGKLVVFGQMICTNIRSGADPLPEATAIDRSTWLPITVEAAKHELCPDTLQ